MRETPLITFTKADDSGCVEGPMIFGLFLAALGVYCTGALVVAWRDADRPLGPRDGLAALYWPVAAARAVRRRIGGAR